MKKEFKHIMHITNKKVQSLFKTSIVLTCIFMFISLQETKAQVISNTGGASITISAGTVVGSDTINNQSGNIDNDGTINLSADYKNAGTTQGDGNYNIAGNWTNTDTFICDNSTVHFNGDSIQNITSPGDENFHNLKINNSGTFPTNRIVIANNVIVSDTLTIAQGDVETGGNKLFLENQDTASLQYTSTTDSRVIGKFERGVNAVGNYLFPIGTEDSYRPMNLHPNETPTQTGSVLSEFIESDPGNAGLPLPDDSVEVYDSYHDGYWNLYSNSGYICEDYNINLDATDFDSTIQNITRIMKRPTSGGDWRFDGVHKDAVDPVVYRDSLEDNIASSGTDFALGHSRPLIWFQPADTSVCDGTDAFFFVIASGCRPLTYQWQENQGSGWSNLSDVGYFGSTTSELNILPANLGMSGYQYRVIITDYHGNIKISEAATLTVNPLPVAYASPMVDTICNNASTYITLSSDVAGTSFELELLHTGNIENASLTIVNDTIIQQTLTNPTDTFDYVEYRIIPTGPIPTDCPGTSVIARVYVEPTPKVEVTYVPYRICNDDSTNIILTSPTEMTDAAVTFDYTSAITGGLTGNSANNDLNNGYVIIDSLHNPTYTPQTATYTITPQAITTVCADGVDVDAVITVHPTPFTEFINYEDSVTCNGDSDAYAQINAENGIGEFDYLWSDNQTSDVATGLLADWYTVTVTDNIGCTKTDSIEIKEPEILYSPVDSANSNLNICFGYSTGAISINPLGGNSAYSYSWSTSETTDSIGGLVRGYYDVTVTDYKGCETDTSVLISESDNPSIKINKTDISCNNLTDGSATAITALTPIAYQWSTGETTQTINGLSAGNYEVTITHLGGCEASDEVTIIDPPLLTASTNSNDITCAGTGNGYVNLTVDGGTLDYWDDYNYSWSPGGETSQNISDLSGGTYYVTVEDEMGCTAIDSAEINEPPPFLSNITPNNVRCYGENNGSIQLNVEGGNGESETFDYLWSNGSTDINQTELEPGYYFVTVSDTVNCTIKDSVEITEPELLSFNMNSSDISCYGYNDGYAAIDIFGGNGGNNIIWQPNNETSDSIYNLAPDEYFVTITDSKGCDTSNSVIIEEPKQINTNTEQTNISCFNSDDGIISLNPEGGISPYRYNWDFNPELSESEANNLPAGNYVVTVTDNNNCEEISEINLTQPNKLTTEIYKTDISCFGFMDGNINLDVSGGTPDYQYQWSNNQSEVSISLLDKGDYNVKITDQHNCKIDTTVTIEEPDALTINAVLTPSLCPDVKNGSIELNISGGTGEYNTYWGIGLYDEDIYEIHSGNYELVITDENLCRLDSLIYLPNIHDICIEIPNAFTPNNDFINDKWEINMFNLYPNVIIEVFDRYGKKVFYSKGYEESQYWDGTYNGKELPMDSYYYIIYLQNGMERLKGVVSIIK